MNQSSDNRYICVGKTRLYDGTISACKLIKRTDPEQRVRTFSAQYILVALKNGEMNIDSIVLSEDGTALVFIDKSEKHVELEDEFVDTEELTKNPNSKYQKKTHYGRRKPKKKYSRKK